MDELERLCLGAMPPRDDAQRDLEAELLKARVLAGVLGDQRAPLQGPRLGGFELVRWLGRGGMGSVFEARDRAHGQSLALKLLHEPGAHGLARLRREFRSLADISHPGLVTLGELYEASGLPFFTMELVPGESLQQWLDRRQPWQLAALERCIAQLVEALCALHARGIAHGDIKPSNLMLRPDGRLVVVDFGVARVLSDNAEPRARRGSGTLAYMAPERIRGGQASPESDWYAVGALLRELLPWLEQGERSQELQAVQRGLLDPSPRRRFAAAELARAIRIDLRRPVSLVAEEDGVFVGRERELSALLRALTERPASAPYVCRVCGEPGIGKTALLEHFAVAAADRGAWVLSGRCYEHEHTRFKGFDLVIDGLARHLQTLPPSAREQLAGASLQALLQVFPGLARAQLRPAACPNPESPAGTAAQIEGNAAVGADAMARTDNDSLTGAASQLLRRRSVGASSAPADAESHRGAASQLGRRDCGDAGVVPEDCELRSGAASRVGRRDCGDVRCAPVDRELRNGAASRVGCSGWSDASSASVGRESLTGARAIRQLAFAGLVALLRSVAVRRTLVICLDDWQWADDDGRQLLEQLLAAGLPCLVVIGVRDGQSLVGCAVQLEIELSPMSEAEASRLVGVLSEHTPLEARSELAREAGGSPLVLRALLQARPQQGHMRDYRALVLEAVSELDAEARELLQLCALAGQPVSMELLARAARLPTRPWQAAARLKRQRMLRSVLRDGGSALAPHHDRIREAVSGALDQPARRARHAALAHAAEQLGLTREAPEFAAEQHLRAGQLSRAAHFAELAGDRARASAALAQAQSQYARALEAHAPARPAQLVAKLADACALVGDVQRAAPLLLEAAARLPEQSEALRLRAAEMFLLAGQAPRGMALLRPALCARGVWLPASEYAAGVLGALSLLRLQLLRSHQRQAPATTPDPRIETTFRLGFLFQLTQPMHGYRLLLWSTERALRHGTAPQRARALAQLAVTQNALGLGTLAAQDALLKQALAATTSDPVEHTYVRACKILVTFAQSDCPATLACAEETRQFVLQARVPVDWLLGPITAVEVSIRVLAGQFRELRAARVEVDRESQALGNRALSVQVDAAHAWAELAVGNPEAMRRFSERALREWVGSQPLYGLALWGEAHRRLYCGELAGAAALLRVEQPRYARAGISRVQSWSLALTLLWGTIALSLSRTPNDAYARAARRYLRALRRARESYAAPSGALLQAGLYRREHASAAAQVAYASAQSGFKALGMEGYAAAAAYRAAELQGNPHPEQASPWFTDQQIADPSAWTTMYAP